ncbi:MAG TPA: sulfite exporter TauE/SafE family protein [Candidatus Baltobacteraceae bacterium]|nr:sulfite exporter TauE/SafE family protein [Candidatus Baltobacteraceae bacterium]
MNLLLAAELAAIGAVAGVLGTLAGLGGGFIVIPVLRLFFGIAPATTAAVSLVMVFANSVSGSIAYLRQGRVDVRLAATVAATGIPTSVLGAYLVGKISFTGFDVLYGLLLLFFSFYLLRRRNAPPPSTPLRVPSAGERVLVDARGERFAYATSVPLSLLCGVILGLVSSFFGIGGGFIFVLFFIALLRMPAHIVAATSTFAILLTSPSGVIAHYLGGHIDWNYAIPLSLGGLVGGQFGPRIARRLSSPQILGVLGYLMLAAAAAMAARHFLKL